MAKILRLLEPTTALGETQPPPTVLQDDTGGAMLTQAEFLADPAGHSAGGKRLAVRVAPADRVEDLAPHLANVALVAIEFPGPGEGRGYTYARLLRQRYGFNGEIRAVGPGVKQDLLFFMVRCGFDAFELAAGENVAEARQALRRFTLAYQPAVPRAFIEELRFTAAHHG
jgi:uncharacterized protein (DUF934 family)